MIEQLEKISQETQPPIKTALNVVHLLSGTEVWGVENYVFNLSRELANSGVRSHIVCTQPGKVFSKFDDVGVNPTLIPISGYLDICAVNDLARFFKHVKADIVHSHLGVDSFIGTAAASKADCPVVASVHFDVPNYMANPWIRDVWRLLQVQKNKRIRHFLPITDNVAAELMRREKVERSKVTVVHPGIDPAGFTGGVRAQKRAELGVNETDFVVLSVGRLEVEKDYPTLISAIKLLEHSPVKVFIVGSGSQENALAAQISQLNLESNVRLLGYRTDVQSLLAACDVFVMPSKAEPFGMAAVEAMFAEKAVIATSGPGLSTIVEDAKTGLLVPPQTPKALADAIAHLQSDRSLCTTFGMQGKLRAQTRFSSKVFANGVLSVYKHVLGLQSTSG